jgi:hypothetical protein
MAPGDLHVRHHLILMIDSCRAHDPPNKPDTDTSDLGVRNGTAQNAVDHAGERRALITLLQGTQISVTCHPYP